MHIIYSIGFTILIFGLVVSGQGAGGGPQKSSKNNINNENSFRGQNNYESHSGQNNVHIGYGDRSRGQNYYDPQSTQNNVHGGYGDRSRETYYGDKHQQRRPYETTEGHGFSLKYVFAFLFIISIICCCVCIGGGIFLLKKKLTSRQGYNPASTTEPEKQNNSEYVAIPMNQTDHSQTDLFRSGIWSGRYFQYDQWHGPSNFSLSFDSSSSTINGSGSDGVGAFNISGKYSTETKEIELVKTYKAGTGDQTENLGHSVTIEVTWDPAKQLFAGNWYVDTSSYRGDDLFELQFKN